MLLVLAAQIGVSAHIHAVGGRPRDDSFSDLFNGLGPEQFEVSLTPTAKRLAEVLPGDQTAVDGKAHPKLVNRQAKVIPSGL